MISVYLLRVPIYTEIAELRTCQLKREYKVFRLLLYHVDYRNNILSPIYEVWAINTRQQIAEQSRLIIIEYRPEKLEIGSVVAVENTIRNMHRSKHKV